MEVGGEEVMITDIGDVKKDKMEVTSESKLQEIHVYTYLSYDGLQYLDVSMLQLSGECNLKCLFITVCNQSPLTAQVALIEYTTKIEKFSS